MGTDGRLTDSARALRRWLMEHSGLPALAAQCPEHQSIRHLTSRQLRALIKEELDVKVSRFWLAQLCDEMEIPRRHQPGPKPPATLAERRRIAKLQASKRWDNWYKNVRNDPVLWERYLARRRKVPDEDKVAVA